MNKLIEAMKAEVKLLRKWANEAIGGGWSTEHVEPMRKRADELEDIIFEAEQNET